MQVKKFEAPTIQEALETIKRELGPEAIILTTRRNKRGFGLMSKSSVEVTAAVSERSLQKKDLIEKRVPSGMKEQIQRLPAQKQAEIYDDYLEKHLERSAKRTQDVVDVGRRSLTGRGTGTGATAAAAPSYAGATAARAAGASAGSAGRITSAIADALRNALGGAPAAEGPDAATAIAAAKITQRRYIDIDEPSEQPAERAQPQAQAQARTAAKAESMGEQGKSLEEEVRTLKRIIEEMKAAQEVSAGASAGAQAMLAESAFSNPALQDAYDELVMNGLDKRFAFTLLKKAAFELGGAGAIGDRDQLMDQLAQEIMASIEVTHPLEERAQQGPTIIALVGPTGVGKTTTLAKLASRCLLQRQLKVGMVNLDNFKVAAFDQLATYSKILNIPFRSAGTKEDLISAIQDFQSLDVVLIDTTGRSQRDVAGLQETEKMLRSVPAIRIQLVMSATTRDTELYEMINRFRLFSPEGLIVSKLDEAAIYGSIYNVFQKCKIPYSYFTTGQRVPDDIEEALKERVVSLLLDV